ncbi:hypothetical protein [Streptomyces sp. 769]|uniref:hypothetical protein n=1 Tax=Streptomyces sp. 769 TaxID=1262452 RepID=UPI00131BB11A|nr:hypothetical protein [Streptomyces sp. 769]
MSYVLTKESARHNDGLTFLAVLGVHFRMVIDGFLAAGTEGAQADALLPAAGSGPHLAPFDLQIPGRRAVAACGRPLKGAERNRTTECTQSYCQVDGGAQGTLPSCRLLVYRAQCHVPAPKVDKYRSNAQIIAG